jgi:glucose/arabinose dehydrogenase/mono/diheme cytochrome c family protein
MNKKIAWVMAALLLLAIAYNCTTAKQAVQRDASGKVIVNPTPSPAYLSPKESMKTMLLPKGYHLQLVASEPMIKEPVAIVWDGNGRMYVAELRTYMQDINGTGQNQPICRVSQLDDTNGDGVMDKQTVFIDSLVMPRMMLCVGNKLLVNETWSYNIWSYGDKNGDGVADEKTLVYKNDGKDTRNLEHQKSGLLWNIDNRIYVSCDPVRYRYKQGQLYADALANSPGGQWGLGNDDYGRLYFSNAGGEAPAIGFHINPSYGLLNLPNQYDNEFQAVWPIIATPDVQGGMNRLRPDTTLNHFTASCGQSIYRGDALPADMRGDLFICEPVGRLVRRAKVTDDNGKITLKNAYTKEEFIASADMNFRPVNSVTGPDGNLYIVDMYRGIIQEATWTAEGSFLRPRILKKGLDKNIGRGRIYRVVYDGYKSSPRPHLLDESSATLVTYLDHPNGWWRDNAQKELIVRGDQSVVPTLKNIALGKDAATGKQTGTLARIHALWTLEGMDAIDKPTLYAALSDADAQIRKAAVWISERYLKSNDEEVIAKLAALKADPSGDVQVQLVASLSVSSAPSAAQLANATVTQSTYAPIMKSVANSVEINKNTKLFGSRLANMPAAERTTILEGEGIYKQLCATCHGADGKGVIAGGSTIAAPPLLTSARISGDSLTLVRILLHGLSGPIDGKTYPDVMAPFGAANNDQWVASILSYIRYNYMKQPGGNRRRSPMVSAETVKQERAKSRTGMWTLEELAKAPK